jgi:hypothetical protein
VDARVPTGVSSWRGATALLVEAWWYSRIPAHDQPAGPWILVTDEIRAVTRPASLRDRRHFLLPVNLSGPEANDDPTESSPVSFDECSQHWPVFVRAGQHGARDREMSGELREIASGPPLRARAGWVGYCRFVVPARELVRRRASVLRC